MAGPAWGANGPPGLGWEKGEWAMGRFGLDWAAVGLGLVWDLLLFSNSSSFSKANTQILFEFKFQFEFKPNTQTKRTMQHQIFKLRQILITCETKIKLNARLNIINLRKLNKAN